MTRELFVNRAIGLATRPSPSLGSLVSREKAARAVFDSQEQRSKGINVDVGH